MKRERDEDLGISASTSDSKVTTAVEFLLEQDQLEKEAKELMPYNPNECTYIKGPIRQPVFACLTCSRDNGGNSVGVCYSCSIQCHSSHELVELFAKRDFVCDCGTTRMSKTVDGACKLRMSLDAVRQGTDTSLEHIRLASGIGLSQRSWGSQSNLEIPAEDIPGSNSYNQNYKGLFCGCQSLYNPLEETGNMIQCFFGFECGEDWFHEECILGYKRGALGTKLLTKGENLLDKLSEPGDDATNDSSIISNNNAVESASVPHFPELDDFDVFICWKCASHFKHVFEILEQDSDIILTSLPRFNQVQTVQEWEQLYSNYSNNSMKKIKLENGSSSKSDPPKSYFFRFSFRDKLKQLSATTTDEKLKSFLLNHKYLYMPDPVYEPPEDDDNSSTTGSLLDLGTEALLSFPREQALEGLQAYDKIKSKLKDFFRPFAEQGKVVTEEEVRTFFGKVKQEDNADT